MDAAKTKPRRLTEGRGGKTDPDTPGRGIKNLGESRRARGQVAALHKSNQKEEYYFAELSTRGGEQHNAIWGIPGP